MFGFFRNCLGEWEGVGVGVWVLIDIVQGVMFRLFRNMFMP